MKYRNPVLEMEVYDQQGRKFDNFSSLNIIWESTKYSLASIEADMPMELFSKNHGNGQNKMHGTTPGHYVSFVCVNWLNLVQLVLNQNTLLSVGCFFSFLEWV